MMKAAAPGKFWVKAVLLITFLQAMTVPLVHLKFLVKVVASTTRELGLSLDMKVLVMDPILTFLRAMMVLLILLVKSRGKVAASTSRDLVPILDMIVSVKEVCLATDHSSIALEHSRSARTPDLTTDQVLTSKARAPLCLMVLAPKYQAKVQLSLTQLTAKYLARMQNFLKERACRAMAPRSLMILIAIRQVRGRSLINPGRSSLTRELLRKILPFQAMGPSRTVLALSSQARVLSLNNRELTQIRDLSLIHLAISSQARVLSLNNREPT